MLFISVEGMGNLVQFESIEKKPLQRLSYGWSRVAIGNP
jgi:hypothetical protein